jgi:hypothetical protein
LTLAAVGSGDPDGSVLLVVGALTLSGVLWALVVRWHQRRQERVDLVALEEELQRRRRRPKGRTDPQLDASQRAFYRTDEPRGLTGEPDPW